MAPHALQKELQKFFDIPIVVIPVPIEDSTVHNECTAWLYAFYAVFAVQHVGRSVVCHYHSVNSQFLLYNLYKMNAFGMDDCEAFIPHAWGLISPEECCSIFHEVLKINDKKTKHTIESWPKDFSIKSFLFNSIKKTMITKCVGEAESKQMILEKSKKNEFAQHAITLQKINTSIDVTLPFHPSRSTLFALSEIICTLLSIDKNHISFTEDSSFKVPPRHYRLYSLLGNLVLCGIVSYKRSRNKSQVIRIKPSHTIYNDYALVGCSVELDIQKYSKKISLKKLYLTMNIGYVANKVYLEGLIEKHVMNSVFFVLGIDSITDGTEIFIKFIDSENISYTSSVEEFVHTVVCNALINTVTEFFFKK